MLSASGLGVVRRGAGALSGPADGGRRMMASATSAAAARTAKKAEMKAARETSKTSPADGGYVRHMPSEGPNDGLYGGKRRGKAGSEERYEERYGYGLEHAARARPWGGPQRSNLVSLPYKRHVQPSSDSFVSLGLDESLVRAMQRAFPEVRAPTGVQAQLVRAVLEGKDVLLRDATGSGKTFGLVLALLGKPRMLIARADDGAPQRVITALVIVPHRDLALQLHGWVARIVGAMERAPGLAGIAQVVVRGAERPVEEAVRAVRATPPHVLICTPQGLQDVLAADGAAVGLDTLGAVVVDEVDYLVETVARKEEGRSFRKAFEKAVRKVARHPGPTREILDTIYAKRLALEDADAGAGAEALGLPQLVLASATLRVHLKDYLFTQSGWLDTANVVKIMGAASDARGGARGIAHSVLIASDTDIRNVDGALPSEFELPAEKHALHGSIADVRPAPHDAEFAASESPFDANALETVAAAFALDVPVAALLVVPNGLPVQRAVWELRQLGVDAEALDVARGSRASANPRLLVATLASTRGMDVAALSHVFVLGLPEGGRVTGRAVDAYVHMAGRVGRFGRAGRVVSVVGSASEAERACRMLASIGVQPVRFEHFD